MAASLAGLLLAGTMVCPAMAGQGVPEANADEALIALGQRIYRQGILPSGEPLHGLTSPGVIRSGADAACAACHRRSGYGMAEGNVIVRPITGPALFQPQPVANTNPRIAHQLGHQSRPAYDDQTLARAIRDGLDMNGRQLANGMPHYALSDAEMKPLLAYLKSLSARPEPGVSDTHIHLATIIQPGVSAEKQRAMLDVLTTFIRDKNAGTRWDEHRRKAGIMRMQRAYRSWVLHAWELTGPPEIWGAQLETYYRKQPVFSIIGGIGEADWTPIHEFSERYEVPCIFPQTPLPGRSRPGFYTLYLSRGVLLEADIMARHFATEPEPKRMVQVFRRNTPGEAAAHELRAALPATGKQRLVDRILDGPADDALLQQFADESPGTALILWLGSADLDDVAKWSARRTTVPPLFISSTLLNGSPVPAQLAASGTAGTAILLVYPWGSPEAQHAGQTRTRLWLQNKGLATNADTVQANTFFAVNIVGDVLSHILDNFSREYFIERIEHAVQQSLVPSSFPHVSLGPDQRFAAKGSYVVRLDPDKGFNAVSDWIVP